MTLNPGDVFYADNGTPPKWLVLAVDDDWVYHQVVTDHHNLPVLDGKKGQSKRSLLLNMSGWTIIPYKDGLDRILDKLQ